MMNRNFSHTPSDNDEGESPLSKLTPWDGNAIMLVDLDAFYASVEQLDHPGWRGKPVIVGGDPHKHGVVSAASYEARAYGVKSAMPSSMAHKLCPDAIWTHGHFDRYREISNAIMSILFSETPHVQQVSIDEAFVDVTPTRFSTEHPIEIAQRVQTSVNSLGVTCSIGLGTSKTIAKIASDRDKPRGLTIVYPGREKAFLFPLPIKTMSGVGPSAEKVLQSHGITTLGDMAFADQALLKRIFGKNADMMRARCLGEDISPVVEDNSVKSVSNETTFSDDLTTIQEIEAAIGTMASKVGRRLRKKNLKGKTISLKVRYSDRSIKSVQRQLLAPSNDELLYTPLLYQMVREVWKEGMSVRLIGVGMSGFEEDELEQEALFDIVEQVPSKKDVKPIIEDSEKREGLLTATDLVKNKFGEDAVQFGRELSIKKRTTGSSSKNPSDYREQHLNDSSRD